MPVDVLICHASGDEAVARALAERIASRRVTAAIAGQSTDDAALLVAVLSSEVDSAQLLHLDAAHAARRPILGIRIAPVPLAAELTTRLERSTIIDAFALALDEHLEQLADLLEEAFANRPGTA